MSALRPLPSTADGAPSADVQSRFVRPVQRHQGLIALTAVAVAASALIASLVQPKLYRASAVVRVPAAPVTQGHTGGPAASARDAAMADLRSAALRSDVARRTGKTPHVTIAAAPRPDEIRVTAEADSARAAAGLANGYVAVDLDRRSRQYAAEVAPQVADLNTRIHALDAQIEGITAQLNAARGQAATVLFARRDDLRRQQSDLQTQLEAQSAAPPGQPVLVSPAKAPGAPVSPHTLRNTLVGLLAGILLGALLAVVLWYREHHRAVVEERAAAGPPLVPRASRPAPPPPPPAPPPIAPQPQASPPPSPEPEPEPTPVPPEPVRAVEAEAEPEAAPAADEESAAERSGPGVPVLGMIPVVTSWRGQDRPLLRREEPTSQAAEAYRTLASTIQRILPHRPLRSLVVTSPAQGDGRTTIVANLGIVLARSGRTVVAVDCDLRNPRLHQVFGLENEAGFTSVLRGEAPLSRAVQQVPDEPRLQVLASGPTPPAPGQLLSAQRTIEVMTALQAQADVVVIDVPTVAPGSDATVVASIADAALVVAGAPAGQAGELARAVDLLDEIDGLVVGIVLNAVADDDTDGRVALLRRDMPRVSLA